MVEGPNHVSEGRQVGSSRSGRKGSDSCMFTHTGELTNAVTEPPGATT